MTQETNDQNPEVYKGKEIGVETVYISKHKNFLGLEVAGGRSDDKDTPIRVKRVIPGGAASDDQRIYVGAEITEVDGKSLTGLSREEAESVLQISFSVKNPVNLGLGIRSFHHL